MNKIYYENQYIREFRATIIGSKILNGKYHVTLDKTAFFPGGGGQFCDLGFIDDEEVENVYEELGVVYHVLENEPINKENIKCTLNWERRTDGMHQHLGQHVLSGCFFKLFSANTVSFHLGKEFSTVDIVGHLEENQMRKVEEFANEVIGKNLKVESIVPLKEELENLGLRRDLPNTDDEIRVVKVGDLDINACCGVHPSSTMELRLIKIIKWEKNKGATRIEFLAGSRAINDTLNKEKYLTDLCKYLNTNEGEALSRVKKLRNEIKESLDENKKMSYEVAGYEAIKLLEESEKIDIFTIVKKIYINKNIKYIEKVVERLVENENVVVLIANKNNEKSNLIFASSKNFNLIGVDELLKKSITLINGKGGGSKMLAQGFGESKRIDECLESVVNSIKYNVKNKNI
ncbi:MAG: DHHA1 domain-containing protein [Clostridium sp.]